METVILIIGISAGLYLFLIGFFTYGWFRKRQVYSQEIGKAGRKVSIVIAARDEEKHIGDLLNDLAGQEYPAELMEIIVVDDHSGDNTSAAVESFIKNKGKPGMILLSNKEPGGSGKKGALALGIGRASGDLILTTDADCRVGQCWVSSLVSGFQRESIKMISGPVCYSTGEKTGDKFQSLEFSSLVASGAGAALAGHPFLCNGACLAYRKEAFIKVNGFEGNMNFVSGDDVFLLHKIKKAFGRQSVEFCKNKEALVRTFPVPGLSAFLRQRIRWASKTRAYSDPISILTALAVFLFNLMLLTGFMLGFFFPEILPVVLALLAVKIIADFPLLWGITGFTGSRELLNWYLPFQVIYPFYIVAAGIGSLFGKKNW